MSNLLKALRAHDPDLAEIGDGQGAILVSPRLQGRIFCQLGGDLIHRLDAARLAQPLPGEFNNLGGNSLWPAPEGGPFAFNYLPGDDRWVVQSGIADQMAPVTQREASGVTVEKTIRLRNRLGTELPLRFRRRVRRVAPSPAGAGLPCLAYESEDALEPLERHPPQRLLLASWSLEQFPGGDEVTAFGLVAQAGTALNFDYYGQPTTAPQVDALGFRIALGGKAKYQFGVRAANAPRLIGAWDRRRGLLILRHTATQQGAYFNIADNDQPRGPWSAADAYSVFNGGALGFYELETIAPLVVADGAVAASLLISRTEMFAGTPEELARVMAQLGGGFKLA